MELIEIPTFNLFDSSIVIFEYDHTGSKYFDAFRIKFSKSDNTDNNEKVLTSTISWLTPKGIKHYIKNSKSLSDYASIVPMSKTTDYMNMYRLNSNSIDFDTKYIFKYLNDSIRLRKNKFNNFDALRFTKNYYIDNDFIDLNKNFFKIDKEKLKHSTSVNCTFTWNIVNKDKSFLDNNCNYSFKFFNNEGTDDSLTEAKYYTFDN